MDMRVDPGVTAIDFEPLINRTVLFVGGKGGVGKTTTAAALALAAAKAGKRTLVVSTDPAHSLADSFATPIGSKPKILAERLTGLEIDPDAACREHIETVKRNVRDLVKPDLYATVDRQLDMAAMAPGTAEAALLERVADLMGQVAGRTGDATTGDDAAAPRDYDLLIFDTAPTGHTLRLLTLPDIMSKWADGLMKHHDQARKYGAVAKALSGGPKGDETSQIGNPGDNRFDDRTKRIRDLLEKRRGMFTRARRMIREPATTGFLLVLIPERMPIEETRRAYETLSRFEVPIAGLIVNRVLPDTADGAFLSERRAQEGPYLDEINRAFANVPQWRVPLRPRDVSGRAALEDVASQFSASGCLP